MNESSSNGSNGTPVGRQDAVVGVDLALPGGHVSAAFVLAGDRTTSSAVIVEGMMDAPPAPPTLGLVADWIAEYKATVERVRQINAPAAGYMERMSDLRAWIRSALEDAHLDLLQCADGLAVLQRVAPIVRYDAAALDALCAADPELAERLAPCRSVFTPRPHLTID